MCPLLTPKSKKERPQESFQLINTSNLSNIYSRSLSSFWIVVKDVSSIVSKNENVSDVKLLPNGISTEPPICTSPRPLHRGILQKSPMWQIPCGLIICSSNCHLSWGELVFCPHSLRRILPYIPVRPDIRCSWKYPTYLLQLPFSQIKESRWQILNFEVMKGVSRVWPCSSLSAKVWTKGSGKDGIEIRLITWTPEPKERSSYLNKRESGTLQVEKKTRFWG